MLNKPIAGPVGHLESFDVTAFKKVVTDYVCADEVERALWLLDNLPSRYRDFPPHELSELKAQILAAMVTPHAYMSCDLDGHVQSPEESAKLMRWYLRAILIRKEVERYNEKGLTPHIVDVGPGEYFIPLGLKHLHASFTYQDVAMDKRTGIVARPQIKEFLGKSNSPQPKIFVALEIIEHLPDPKDLLIEAHRHCGGWPDRVHLSTPQYCFDGRIKNWNKPCGLPHLRTYTPQEFMITAMKLFPGYAWEIYQSEIMSLRGQKLDAADPKGNLLSNEEIVAMAEEYKKEMGL